MTLRKSILAGLVAALAMPAVTHAASSGLTAVDIERGQVYLLSHRQATSGKQVAEQAQRTPAKTARADDVQHKAAMDTGVRMTKGSMECADKK